MADLEVHLGTWDMEVAGGPLRVVVADSEGVSGVFLM